MCTTFEMIGITQPRIQTHDLSHTKRALYQSATGVADEDVIMYDNYCKCADGIDFEMS